MSYFNGSCQTTPVVGWEDVPRCSFPKQLIEFGKLLSLTQLAPGLVNLNL